MRAQDVVDFSRSVREGTSTIAAAKGGPPLGVLEVVDGDLVLARQDLAQPGGDIGEP
jgi:hypothetical protein